MLSNGELVKVWMLTWTLSMLTGLTLDRLEGTSPTSLRELDKPRSLSKALSIYATLRWSIISLGPIDLLEDVSVELLLKTTGTLCCQTRLSWWRYLLNQSVGGCQGNLDRPTLLFTCVYHGFSDNLVPRWSPATIHTCIFHG